MGKVKHHISVSKVETPNKKGEHIILLIEMKAWGQGLDKDPSPLGYHCICARR
jgi:hypothetical protein